MKTGLLFVLGIVLVSSCLALTCSKCDTRKCGNAGVCRYGWHLDVCKCCPVCYKGPGEKCGGPFNMDGICAWHLKCVQAISDNNDSATTIAYYTVSGEDSGTCIQRPRLPYN